MQANPGFFSQDLSLDRVKADTDISGYRALRQLHDSLFEPGEAPTRAISGGRKKAWAESIWAGKIDVDQPRRI